MPAAHDRRSGGDGRARAQQRAGRVRRLAAQQRLGAAGGAQRARERRPPWLPTNGVNTHGAAAQVIHVWEDKSRLMGECPKSPSVKKNEFAVNPLVHLSIGVLSRESAAQGSSSDF